MKNMQKNSILVVTVCLPATEDAELSVAEWNDLRGPKLRQAVERAVPIGMVALMKKGLPTTRLGFFGGEWNVLCSIGGSGGGGGRALLDCVRASAEERATDAGREDEMKRDELTLE